MKIEPIKLLSGSHADVATTGSGCIMNVASYLNGDAQITDYPDCTCETITPIAIWLNDMATDQQRQRLLLFVPRVMGTKTTNRAIISARLDALVAFADGEAAGAALAAAWAAWAAGAARAAGAAFQSDQFERGLALLDALCPPAEFSSDQAKKMVELARVAETV